MDLNTLNAAAGGVGGFADAFLAAMQQKKTEENQQARFAAAIDLQREISGLKKVTGLELSQLGQAMGISIDKLKAIKPDVKYDAGLGKEWLSKLAEGETAKTKDAGATDRAKIKAASAKAVADTKVNKGFKPDAASAATLQDLIAEKGYKRGTPIQSVVKAEDLKDILAAYPERMKASIQAAGQQDNIDVDAPFEVVSQGGFWDKPIIKVLPGYRAKAAKAAMSAPANAPATPGEVALTPQATPALPSAGGLSIDKYRK